MAVYQTKLSSILAKVEGTEGSDSSPVNTDGFFADIEGPTIDAQFRRNPSYTGKGSLLAGVLAERSWTARVSTYLRGAGQAYSALKFPKNEPLFRMCGFQEAHSYTGGSEQVSYTLRSDSFESYSVYIYRGGKVHKLLGCRGLPSFNFPLGGFAQLVADLRAPYATPTDGALVAVSGEPAIGYPTMLSSAFQIGSENFAAKHGDITIDCGRKVALRKDGTTSSGLAGAELLGDREPTITFTCEATTEAGYAFFAKLVAGTQFDCTFQVGTTQYNRVKVSAPYCQFERLEYVDDNGILCYRATASIISATGVDDDLVITFD